jgi:hypothetical protein
MIVTSGMLRHVFWYFTDVSEVLSDLMVEVVSTSETSINLQQTQRRNTPEGSYVNARTSGSSSLCRPVLNSLISSLGQNVSVDCWFQVLVWIHTISSCGLGPDTWSVISLSDLLVLRLRAASFSH